MPIYLACGAEEAVPALPLPYRAAQLGFRLAADYPSVLGPALSARERGTLLVLQDDVQPPYEPTAQLAYLILTLCAEMDGGLVCDFVGPPAPFWSELVRLLDEQSAHLHVPLLVPERYADGVQAASVMLRPALGEVPYDRQLKAAAARYRERAVLQLLPLRQDFALPCADGGGTSLPQAALQALLAAHAPSVFRDDALLCDYFGYLDGKQLHLVLFDTPQTLAEKQKQAEAAGFIGAIGLHQELCQYL